MIFPAGNKFKWILAKFFHVSVKVPLNVGVALSDLHLLPNGLVLSSSTTSLFESTKFFLEDSKLFASYFFLFWFKR